MGGGEREMGLERIGGLAIHIIMKKLGAEGTGSVACVSRRFRDWAGEESLWSTFCADELHHTSPQDPHGNPIPTFKAAYQVWRESFGMYPWPLVLRVKRCWDRLKSWLAANFPEALATLRKGASEDDIKKLENFLKINLPVPTRVLYRFCDGQALRCTEYSGDVFGSPFGLIGGYSFYDHQVNIYLLPLNQIIKETKRLARRMGFSSRSEYIVVANNSFTASRKIFLLNCANGELSVGTRNFARDGGLMRCVPNELINVAPDSGRSQQQDAMLLWLEEHGNRLHNGIIGLREEENIRSINLFPKVAPYRTAAITNGVQVRASALLVPEYSDLRDKSEKYLFAYSIRMSLLPEGCVIKGLSFASCQLYWRRWTFRANDVVVSDVDGEAVIGKFPLLRPGEDEFVYESCTPLSTASGSVEGSFTFVPGSLADPRGDPFEVEVARFPLQLPDYIF